MMKWYCSSMLLRGPVAPAVEAITAAGFDGAEVWVDQAVAHGERPENIAATARQVGAGLSVHASSYDINLTAWNPGIRAESGRQTQQSVRFAADLGADVVVVHPGRRSSSRDATEDYWPLILESLEPVDDLADRLGVRVAVELMERRPREVVMYPEDARRLLGHGYRAVGVTVDLAHAYTHGDPLEFLDALTNEEIEHIHLSDSDPSTVHLPLGKGDAPLKALVHRLAERDYGGIVTIEGYEPGRGRDLIEANLAHLAELGAEVGASA